MIRASLHIGRRFARAWPELVNGPSWLVVGLGFALHWSTTVGTFARWLWPDGPTRILLVHPVLMWSWVLPSPLIPLLWLTWTVVSAAAIVWWFITTFHLEQLLGSAGYGLERATQAARWARSAGTPWAFALTVLWGIWLTSGLMVTWWSISGLVTAWPSSPRLVDIVVYLVRVSIWPALTLLLIRSTIDWRDEVISRGSKL